MKKIRESSWDNEKKEKIELRKDVLLMALGRSETLIIRKDINPSPNTSIKTTKKSIVEAKKNLLLSSPLRIIFNDLNTSFMITK